MGNSGSFHFELSKFSDASFIFKNFLYFALNNFLVEVFLFYTSPSTLAMSIPNCQRYIRAFDSQCSMRNDFCEQCMNMIHLRQRRDDLFPLRLKVPLFHDHYLFSYIIVLHFHTVLSRQMNIVGYWVLNKQ